MTSGLARRPVLALLVAVFAAACTTTGTTPVSPAKPGDLAYCQKLVDQYTTYVGSVGGSLGGNVDRGGQPADIEAKVAIAQCQEGNPAPAIPVLEQKLRDAKVTVPPRSA
jgi:hypothetical protein